MSFLPILLQFFTTSILLFKPYSLTLFTLDLLTNDIPLLLYPNWGCIYTGSHVGILAFASPIKLYAILPCFIITCGLTPNDCGDQITKSAIFPTSTLPTKWLIP
eukprot:NODE_889_length_3425_cov_0.118761.p3 type:complete len:104 gc:universal NODE_889_length_3425_cov_0.118761:859-1170(+)